MAEKTVATDDRETDGAPAQPAPAPTPRRPSGHRGADVRDTVAEMTARAQELSMEAGSKIASAMKDVINAAAGITGFAIESARDLVQYMIRRGQMTPDEGERLMREVEEAHGRRQGAGGSHRTVAVPHTAEPAAAAAAPAAPVRMKEAEPVAEKAPAAKQAHAKPPAPARASKPAAKHAKPTVKTAAKAAKAAPAKGAKSAPAKKPATPAARAKATKTAAKSAASKSTASRGSASRSAAKKKR